MLSHDVYFTLHDRSEAARAALVAACKDHLTGHSGTVFFACGTRCDELSREVNDLDFDVALHLVFESKEAHDAYQIAPRHDAFIAQQKANWARVRVFDSIVEVA